MKERISHLDPYFSTFMKKERSWTIGIGNLGVHELSNAGRLTSGEKYEKRQVLTASQIMIPRKESVLVRTRVSLVVVSPAVLNKQFQCLFQGHSWRFLRALPQLTNLVCDDFVSNQLGPTQGAFFTRKVWRLLVALCCTFPATQTQCT